MIKPLDNGRLFGSLATILFSILLLFGSASAATFTVTKTADTNDGVCDADCSLREAIAAANAQFSNDIISFFSPVFSTPQQINLIGDHLTIANNGSVRFDGTGANKLTISGSNAYRVFFINQNANVTIQNMTIKDGRGFGQNFLLMGGAIYNSPGAQTTIFRTVVTNSRVANFDGGISLFGGGIYNLGVMLIRFSRVENNSVPSSAPNTSEGGGIYNGANGYINIEYSSVTNNSVVGNGGGIHNAANATLWITNSTVSTNSATGTNGNGGALYNLGTVNATSITVAKNSASTSGGGVWTSDALVYNSRNSIYADNTVGADGRDFRGTMISGGFNLIENTTDTVIQSNTTTDILNQDPKLRPLVLSENGLSYYHAPDLLSPAIDKGKAFEFGGEQREFARPTDLNSYPNAPGGDGSDIGSIELRQIDLPNPAPFDFDGDRKTDVGIYRPSTGAWWITNSSNNTFSGGTFGTSTDIPVAADYSGDGRTDLAYYTPSTGTWNIKRSQEAQIVTIQLGASGDIPAPGDFDGDNRVDAAVYRPSTGQWFIRRSNDGVVTTQYFGIAEDKPAVADYDGDGVDDVAIYRPSTGAWWINRSSLGIVAIQFGASGDKAVQGDYTGDGKADLALWRESNGFWYILRSEDFSFYGFPLGSSGDMPVQGDYDGDGKIDAGIYRPSNGVWYLLRSTQGFSSQQFGISGDVPVPGIFVR